MPDSWNEIDGVSLNWSDPELKLFKYYAEAVRLALLERRGARDMNGTHFINSYLELTGIPSLETMRKISNDLDIEIEQIACPPYGSHPPPPAYSGWGIMAYLNPALCVARSFGGELFLTSSYWYGQYTTNPAWTNNYIFNYKGLTPALIDEPADIKVWLKQKKVAINELYMTFPPTLMSMGNFTRLDSGLMSWPRIADIPQCSTVRVMKGIDVPEQYVEGQSPLNFTSLISGMTYLSFKCPGGFKFID